MFHAFFVMSFVTINLAYVATEKHSIHAFAPPTGGVLECA